MTYPDFALWFFGFGMGVFVTSILIALLLAFR